jgi:hypothetical protein
VWCETDNFILCSVVPGTLTDGTEHATENFIYSPRSFEAQNSEKGLCGLAGWAQFGGGLRFFCLVN